MNARTKRGICLSSFDIRQWITDGKIISGSDESRVQPSSFEPATCDEMFVLDTEAGIFRPQANKTLYRTLLELPRSCRQRISIVNGAEIKKGFSYLIPLETRLKLDEDERIKSSPKSSLGRVFLNTRMLTDYNPCFDEVSWQNTNGAEIDLWLLIQPLTFNLIIYPGISLNQIRLFTGYGAQLSPSEILDEFERNPLFYKKLEDGSITPAIPTITDSLQVHLDLLGRSTQGIVGLRARHTPEPIDLGEKEYLPAEDFFEPVKTGGRIVVRPGEHYLFSSQEILSIPPHLSAELRSNSHLGIMGPLHLAGFVDNGFSGDLVFEAIPHEVSNMSLEDGMPLSTLDVFRTNTPDKVYGLDIGSSYQGQTGPRVAKYFKPIDFGYAAKNYGKLDREVLVQDAKKLMACRINPEFLGFEFATSGLEERLNRIVKDGFLQSRYDCEYDVLILQPIPYVVVCGPDNTLFAYVRAKNIQDYGDARLFGKHSIGLGGHITTSDAPDYLKRNIEREVMKEEAKLGNHTQPILVGTLMAHDEAVDTVHFGLVYKMHTDTIVKPNESSIKYGRMIGIAEIMNDPNRNQKYETWSRILVDYLPAIQSFNP